MALGAHGHQVSDLVLAPGGIVDAGPSTLRPGLEPTPVDGDDRQLGGDVCLREKTAALEIVNLLITLLA